MKDIFDGVDGVDVNGLAGLPVLSAGMRASDLKRFCDWHAGHTVCWACSQVVPGLFVGLFLDKADWVVKKLQVERRGADLVLVGDEQYRCGEFAQGCQNFEDVLKTLRVAFGQEVAVARVYKLRKWVEAAGQWAMRNAGLWLACGLALGAVGCATVSVGVSVRDGVVLTVKVRPEVPLK